MKILLIGDTLLNKDNIIIDNKIKRECKNADLVIMNLEGPITTSPKQKSLGSAIASKPQNVSLLKELNVSVAILGNNHIMDHGEQGLEDTKDILFKNNIKYVGAGCCQDTKDESSVIKVNKFVVFSYSHLEGPMCSENGCGPVELPNIKYIETMIEKYKKRGYTIIFNYHGGEEFFTVPWLRRRGFLRRISRAGADIVFAHHSHSIQPIEIISKRVIIYSPGNFIMDTPYQRNHSNTDQGLIISIGDQMVKRYQIKFNRQEKYLELINTNELSLSEDKELDENQIIKTWVNECKRIFRKPINRKLPLRNKKIVIYLVRYTYMLRKLIKVKNKKRDFDILFSSLPLIGYYYSKKLYRKGYKNFRF